MFTQVLLVLKKLPKTVYIVACTTFFMRVGQFMSLPFLAIYLTREGLFTSGQIGTILGISGLFLSVTGLFNGIYVDRKDYRTVLIIALLMCGICYASFAFTLNQFYGLLLLNAGLGWLRSLIEISLITMLAKNTPSENLTYGHSARIIAANLGAVIGPIFGALMVTRHFLIVFLFVGVIHVFLGILILLFSPKYRLIDNEKIIPPIYGSFCDVFKDKVLTTITIINLILWTVYAQLETTIPQYLAESAGSSQFLFSAIIAINAITCVIFQSIIIHWAENTSFKTCAIIGCCMFSFSFLLISMYPTSVTMIISVIFMSLAELFTLPINGLLVLRKAPNHLLASYNGLASLGFLGLSIGPTLGGYGLYFIKDSKVFLLSALLPALAIWLYVKYVSD